MIKVPFRPVLISLIALVAVGGLVIPSLQSGSTNGPAADGSCTTHGITVIVDFGSESNLPPIEKCVVANEATGWQLLQDAGFQVNGTAEYPNTFVCRINEWPDENLEDCMGTPGLIGGSWVYFYSKAGGDGWQRSPVGAATRTPLCGEAEGWLFVNHSTGDQKFTTPKIKPRPFSC